MIKYLLYFFSDYILLFEIKNNFNLNVPKLIQRVDRVKFLRIKFEINEW